MILLDARILFPDAGVFKANISHNPPRIHEAKALTTTIVEGHAGDDVDRLYDIVQRSALTDRAQTTGDGRGADYRHDHPSGK